MHAIIYVFEFPPRQSCKILVSFEFLKVINCYLCFSIVDKAEITFPSSSKPRLILMPSFRIAPVAPVFFALSEPARSTKKNLAVIVPSYCSFPFPIIMDCLMVMVKMAWERELASFISVLAVVLFLLPFYSKRNIWSASATFSSLTPVSVTEPSFSYLMDTIGCCLGGKVGTSDLWDALKEDQ